MMTNCCANNNMPNCSKAILNGVIGTGTTQQQAHHPERRFDDEFEQRLSQSQNVAADGGGMQTADSFVGRGHNNQM